MHGNIDSTPLGGEMESMQPSTGHRTAEAVDPAMVDDGDGVGEGGGGASSRLALTPDRIGDRWGLAHGEPRQMCSRSPHLFI